MVVPLTSEAALLAGFLMLLLCQLAGEFLVQALHLAIPGPVVGLLLLLLLLLTRRPKQNAGVVRAADTILRYLPLLFIPAGVGLIAYLPALGSDWVAVAAALVLSYLAGLVVTAAIGAGAIRIEDGVRARRAARREERKDER